MLRHFILPAFLCMQTFLSAEPRTVWAQGVTEQSGWQDFNKAFDGSDDELCWAITAANLIDWWQRQSATTLPPGTPQSSEILHEFSQSFANSGSDPDQALHWWFTGEYAPARDDCAALRKGANGGFLKNALPSGTQLKGDLLTSLRGSQVTADTATATLIHGAQTGAAFWIGVSYVSPKGRPAMHSLNVWGVRYDTSAECSPQIYGIWIADSDDFKTGLTYVPLRVDKGMLIFDCPDHPIYGRISRIELDTLSMLKPSTKDDFRETK